jgi:hypothetical protein
MLDFVFLVQTAASLISATGVVVLIIQLRLQHIQLEKQREASAVSFILQVEGQFDGLWEALLSQDASSVRKIWLHEIPEEWDEGDIAALVWMARRFTQIGRVINLLENGVADTGLSEEKRKKYRAPWENSLRLYKSNKYMRFYYEHAKKSGVHNAAMMQLAQRVFENDS